MADTGTAGTVTIEFTELADTPSDYTGDAGKFIKVNAGEDALEYGTIAGGGDVLGPAVSDDETIARFNGTDNKTIQASPITIADDGSINNSIIDGGTFT